jgi:hypothetical protein
MMQRRRITRISCLYLQERTIRGRIVVPDVKIGVEKRFYRYVLVDVSLERSRILMSDADSLHYMYVLLQRLLSI